MNTVNSEVPNQVEGIHPSAIIDPTALIGARVSIGAGVVIGPGVEIGDDCRIDPQVIIYENTRLGHSSRVYAHATLGGDPQDMSYDGQPTYLEIGHHAVIRENCTLNRGSSAAGSDGVTRVGNHCWFLANTHVGHDCQIGDRVLMVSYAGLSGHVVVDDYVIIGGYVGVHQFCRIGAYSFLSHSAQIGKDVLPYIIMVGDSIPAVAAGLNTVGLRRHGFSAETIKGLKEAYRIVFSRGLKLVEARSQLADLVNTTPEIQRMIDMLDQSKRGVIRREGRGAAE